MINLAAAAIGSSKFLFLFKNMTPIISSGLKALIYNHRFIMIDPLIRQHGKASTIDSVTLTSAGFPANVPKKYEEMKVLYTADPP